MVKRYPHIVTIKTSSFQEVDGELQSQEPLKAPIKGRVESLSKPKLISKEGGDNIEVNLCIYTKQKPLSDAVGVIYEGKEYEVIQWEPWQSHSIIYLK